MRCARNEWVNKVITASAMVPMAEEFVRQVHRSFSCSFLTISDVDLIFAQSLRPWGSGSELGSPRLFRRVIKPSNSHKIPKNKG